MHHIFDVMIRQHPGDKPTVGDIADIAGAPNPTLLFKEEWRVWQLN